MDLHVRLKDVRSGTSIQNAFLSPKYGFWSNCPRWKGSKELGQPDTVTSWTEPWTGNRTSVDQLVKLKKDP